MAEPAPAARVPVEQWMADAVAAAAESWDHIGGAVQLAESVPVWGWVLGALGVAVPVVRQFLPGIWGALMDGGWKLLSRSTAVRADDAAHRLRVPMQRLLAEIEANPTLLPMIRDHLPEDLLDEFDDVRALVRLLQRDESTRA